MFDLRNLERFVAIAECGSFRRAAGSLGMTQPALSRRIAVLEEELGVLLFSRAHRQIVLTEAGHVLLREARALLERAALAERVLRQTARETRTSLRLATRSTSRYRVVPVAIRRLRELHPDFRVAVEDRPLPELLDDLRGGEIDLALLHGPVSIDRGLRRARLRSEPLLVALPEHHPFAERAAIASRDLVAEAFVEIVSHDGVRYNELQRGVCTQAGFVPNVVQEVASVEMLAMYVAAGTGIALMHDPGGELPVPGVVYRPIDPAAPPVELSAIWRADDTNRALVPFLACLTDAAQEQASLAI